MKAFTTATQTAEKRHPISDPQPAVKGREPGAVVAVSGVAIVRLRCGQLKQPLRS